MKTTDLLILNIARRQTALPLTDELAAILESPAPEEKLEECLPSGLSNDDRQLLCWRYQDELGDDAIARMLGITPAACRVRLHRARGRYAKLLQEDECNKFNTSQQIKAGGGTR